MNNGHRQGRPSSSPHIQTPQEQPDEFLYHTVSGDGAVRPYNVVLHVEQRDLSTISSSLHGENHTKRTNVFGIFNAATHL